MISSSLALGHQEFLGGTSLAVQWLRLRLPLQEVRVSSLVGELRSHMPPVQKTRNIKQKQYCNKFNKDFKNGPYQKNLKKKKKEFLGMSIRRMDKQNGVQSYNGI